MTLEAVTKQLDAFMHGEEELLCTVEKRVNGNKKNCERVKGLVTLDGRNLKLTVIGKQTEIWRIQTRCNIDEESISISVLPLSANPIYRHLTLIHI